MINLKQIKTREELEPFLNEVRDKNYPDLEGGELGMIYFHRLFFRGNPTTAVKTVVKEMHLEPGPQYIKYAIDGRLLTITHNVELDKEGFESSDLSYTLKIKE